MWRIRWAMSGMSRRTALAAAAACVLGLSAAAGAGEAPSLSLPLSCDPGRTCFVQSYVDVKPGPEALDFACGGATVDGHSGVDFRVLSAAASAAGIPVLAAADGVVNGTRDGDPDAFARDAGRAASKGRECGNGVVVDHGGGWETQYCHLRSGSVRVKEGGRVVRGDRLGAVGYSGFTDIAHVQFIVRHNGEVVDPYATDRPPGRCGLNEPGGPRTLWDAAAAQAFPYREGEIISSGFATHVPAWSELETDHAPVDTPASMSRRFVFFARVANVRAGDRIRISVRGPAGIQMTRPGEPLAKNEPVHVAHVARRLKGERWPVGRYYGEAQLVRAGSVVSEAHASFDLY